MSNITKYQCYMEGRKPKNKQLNQIGLSLLGTNEYHFDPLAKC